MDASWLDNGKAEEQLETLLESVAESMSVEALKVLAVRLGKLPPNASFQDVYIWVSQDMAEVERILSGGADLLSDETERALHDGAEACDAWAQPYYDYRGKEQTAALEDMTASTILRHAGQSSRKTAEKLCRTRVCGLVGPDGFKPMQDAYTDMLTNAIIQQQAGRSTEDVLPDLVEQLSESGLKVKYRSGATRDLYSAVSMNLSDGFAKAMDETREAKAVDFGADGYAISAHSMCAPDHIDYQGKRFTFAEFDAIQAKLKRPIGMYNCKHHTTKVIVGIGRGAYTDEQRKQLKELSEKPVTVGTPGREKTMTAYEFTQRQRQLETRCRKLRGAAQIADAAGEQDLAEKYRAKAQAVRTQYEAESKQAKIRTRPERLEIYDWKTLDR